MQEMPLLDGLNHEEKDAFTCQQWQLLPLLTSESEKLHRKRAKKIAKDSSFLPAKKFKLNQTSTESRSKVHETILGCADGGHKLSLHSNQTVLARAKTCPYCRTEVVVSNQQLGEIYGRLELPLVKLQAMRVELYGSIHPGCQQRYEVSLPVGLEPVISPYGDSIVSLVIYLRYGYAISYQRLSHQLIAALYGLTISEGVVANLLRRLRGKLATLMAAIVQRLRSARHRLATSMISRCYGALKEVLKLKLPQVDEQRSLKRYRKIRRHLLYLLEDKTVLLTDNTREQVLRWSVVFRKVTNGFCSDWGSQLFTRVRSLTSKANRQVIFALEVISRALICPQADGLSN